MSKNEEEEEEEEAKSPKLVEEVEEERFYESLDRILSSSNSSTSNSEDDNDTILSPRRHRTHHHHHHHHCHGGKSSSNSSGLPKFPVSAQNYDVWVSSESFSLSSLEQRRDRLLRALGLSSDPSLSRRKTATVRSVSFDHHLVGCSAEQPAKLPEDDDNSRVINRSKSDQCNSSPTPTTSTCSSSSILSIRSVSDTVYRDSKSNNNKYNVDDGNHNATNINNDNGVVDNLVSDGCVGSVSVSGLGGFNKMPAERIGSRQGISEIEGECGDLKGGKSGIEEIEREKVCTIKNLDTGKEFVVKGAREDGVWNKVKEVGTGRHLTMEEFEMSVGHSPIVQELMRRQNVEDQLNNNKDSGESNGNGDNGSKSKKKVSWFRSIKNVASSVTGYKERRSSDERDTSSEKGGRRSSSATDDSQDTSFHGPERIRVRQYGKSVKDLTALYKSQEIQAHNGSIWTIKFSLDGRFLASAGEDCVIHVWQVVESERKGELLVDRPDDASLSLLVLTNGSPEPNLVSQSLDSLLEKKRRGRPSISRKSVSLDHIKVPETVFGLSEKPICSFQGHSDDVLDLSWSKSQLLLSSSMDKTVRLWNLSSKTCLKIFSHSDYVTCIQFNPVDDRYFISGSLDAKVRIWSIPDRQVVDWNDLHEMVTAACYTPDGQGALVGSYKGSCRLYNTSENKLQQKCQINLQNKKKRSHLKKITGFQFAPGSSSEVLITSADSRVRVVDGLDLVHKFKGFRNTNSQISASLTANGKYVVCASEDSHVYVWKHEGETRPSRSKGVTVTRSYEHFHCQDVSVAIPWPGMGEPWGPQDLCSEEQNVLHHHHSEEVSTANHPPTPVEEEFNDNDNDSCSPSGSGCSNSPFRGTISNAPNSYFFDRISLTWPEEKLIRATKNRSPRISLDFSNGSLQNRAAWGLVIVTAGLRGEIRTFLNYGLPVRI
ncbi:hypothetical protein SOVF_152250 [Spinacia oleracea]|uniref:WD repeat-containing protein 44 n=1 Tax=Spinacia oleracea TaxID=3562 RepID=A0A9R0KB45_SPIOL|nr:uncharacterized protein LOC110804077 [Spinacia oleracea]KNA09591.1 hypothetical protein SOVF_152250 [Spinacia oleracea]